MVAVTTAGWLASSSARFHVSYVRALEIRTDSETPPTRWAPIIISTWNPNDPCFDWKRPCFGGSKAQNRGQTGSR